MRKKLTKQLLEALHAPRTVRVLPYDEKWLIYGYVVGLSDMFVLVHMINADLMCLNGYAAVPLREIADLPADKQGDFRHRALQLKGIHPVRQPDILLLDFPGLLSSADAHFPLITIEASRLYPKECHIGRVAKLTRKSVDLREIDRSAHWSGIGTYRFKNITRVEFGSGYEEALWRVSEHEKESPKTHE